MKVLSLFDGISCARVALERAGIEVEKYYASEIDKYAIQISSKNYPDTVQLGDVSHIQKDMWESWQAVVLDDIDLLIGGSPCQDLSIAKKNRKGLDGSRSGLFWEYVRILNEVKPKYFILENVNSMPKEAKQIISDTLGVEPIMINAALVSAQNRKRLFWVGKLDEFGTYQQVEIPQPDDRGIFLKDILEENVDEKYFLLKDNDLTPSGNPDIAGTLDTGTWLKRYEQIRRVYKITSKSPTMPTGTGGGVMTKIAIPVALRNRGEGKKPEYNGTDKANSMTTVQTDSMVAIIQKGRGYNKGGIKALDGKTPTLSASKWQDNNHLTDGVVIRKLTPIECERLQGLPDGYTEGVSNTQRYKALGNAFNVDVVAHILSFIKRQIN